MERLPILCGKLSHFVEDNADIYRMKWSKLSLAL